MNLCSRCKQRPAVIFINKIQGDKVASEGLCIRCAKEMNLKPFSDYIEKMGIGDDDLDMIEHQVGQMMDGLDSGEMPGAGMDMASLFGSLPMMPTEDGAVDEIPSDSTKGNKEKKNAQKQKSKNKMLDGFCIHLTQKARNGELDRVIGREEEFARTIQILCRRQKNNPCLIGEPGVGKTAIAELLAQCIADKKVPVRLLDKEVYLLDLTALVAGTHFRGQFESRVKSLVDEVKKLGNIILVIDEIHTIVGAGDSEGGMSCANILKPALSRGEIQIIGATTLSEYRKYIEKDQALERRFQPVMVEEPTLQKTVQILSGIKKYYESFHGLNIPENILRITVTLSERYITDRFLPDKAIDILDEACAKKVVESDVINRIDAIENELKTLRSEKESLEALQEPDDSTYARLAQIKVSESRLMDEFSKLSSERDGIFLDVDDIARVIESWTGIPASNISENEFEKISSLKETLRSHIVGQEEAIDAVCRAIKRQRAGIGVKEKPASFIFAGPTGVGKTELVKVLASKLFDSNESLIRLDMSEYMEKHSVSRIIGSPPGYVGYDDAGQLTEKIRRKPYSVILFDELEKAHPDLLNILLQILDDGKINDAHGKEINFKNTVIVMTTNAGSQITAGKTGFGHSLEEAQSDRTKRGLEAFLRPEFLNRVDEIITFNHLSREDFIKISSLRLEELKEALSERGLTLNFDSEVVKFVAEKSYSDQYGARNMARFIQTEIEDKIADFIVSDRDRKICRIDLTHSNGTIILSAQ